MDIRIIAFGMLFILASLLLWVKYYYPIEQKKMQAERDYFETILDFKSNKTNIENVILKAKVMSKLKHISLYHIIKLIENDTGEKLQTNALE